MTKHSQKVAAIKQPRLPIWLPLIIVAGVILIAVIAIGGSNNSTPANYVPEVKGAPALKIDKEKVDLGDVKLGQTVTVLFDVTNVGDQPLRFQEAPYVEVIEGC